MHDYLAWIIHGQSVTMVIYAVHAVNIITSVILFEYIYLYICRRFCCEEG